MPNINAALGLAQIENLNKFIQLKRKLYVMYSEVFQSIEFVNLFSEPKGCNSNYWLQTIILEKNKRHLKDEILKHNHDNGINTRPAWKPLHTLKPFKSFPRSSMNNTLSLYERIINLPSSPSLIYDYKNGKD